MNCNNPNYRQLKPEITHKIRNSKALKGLLIVHFNISSSTLQKWLREDNKNFIQYDSLEVIGAFIGVEQLTDLLTNPSPMRELVSN